jgi:hypothetical protein
MLSLEPFRSAKYKPDTQQNRDESNLRWSFVCLSLKSQQKQEPRSIQGVKQNLTSKCSLRSIDPVWREEQNSAISCFRATGPSLRYTPGLPGNTVLYVQGSATPYLPYRLPNLHHPLLYEQIVASSFHHVSHYRLLFLQLSIDHQYCLGEIQEADKTRLNYTSTRRPAPIVQFS